MDNCVITFSPYIAQSKDDDNGIQMGKKYWLSDQLIGGKRAIGKPFIERFNLPNQLPFPRFKGYKYLRFYDCDNSCVRVAYPYIVKEPPHKGRLKYRSELVDGDTFPCCIGNTCTMESVENCQKNNGISYTNLSSCESNTCIGACCLGTSCSIKNQKTCSGVFFNHIKSCSPNPCTKVATLGCCGASYYFTFPDSLTVTGLAPAGEHCFPNAFTFFSNTVQIPYVGGVSVDYQKSIILCETSSPCECFFVGECGTQKQYATGYGANTKFASITCKTNPCRISFVLQGSFGTLVVCKNCSLPNVPCVSCGPSLDCDIGTGTCTATFDIPVSPSKPNITQDVYNAINGAVFTNTGGGALLIKA